MRYSKLVADNENTPSLGGGIIPKNEKFQYIYRDGIIINIVHLLNLDGISKSEFIAKLDEILDDEVKFNKIEEELFLILNVASRYLMIKEVISKESQIHFGLWGIAFYLGLTCFDSLGQKEGHKTFDQWLSWKRNEKVNEIEQLIRDSREIKLREKIEKLYIEYYKPKFGVKISFYDFLNSIKENESFKNLISCIGTSKYVEGQLQKHGWEDDFKKDWLYYFRNNFTHNIKNTRLSIEQTNWKLNYSVKSKTFDINIQPEVILVYILNCIRDGIEMKFQKLELL